MALGVNLKEILKQKNMTIKDLSKETGISVNTLYSITKRDGRMARFDIIKKICEALDVTESELLGFDIQPEDYQNAHGRLRVFEVHRNSDLRNGYISSEPSVYNSDFVRKISAVVESHMINEGIAEEKQIELLYHFDTLNSVGQQKAIEQVEMLTKIPEYRAEPQNPPAESSAPSNQDE